MSPDPGVEPLLIAATFALGLRHGVDWDHLSAIADLTGADLRRSRAAMVAVLYALGHGAAVFALGALAVAAGGRLPTWIDPVMERVVGATLLVLALAVVRSAWATGRPVARGVLMLQGLARVRAQLRRQRQVIVRHAHGHGHDGLHTHVHSTADATSGTAVQTKHRHDHVHQVAVTGYGSGAAFVIGLLHGVGAETGTQAVVLAGAAHATATGSALVVVGAFVAGVVVTTVLIALAAAAGWATVGSHHAAVRVLALIAAAASATVGALYLFGAGDRLPSILIG